MDYIALKAEITADPLGRYGGLSDAEIAASLNAVSRQKPRKIISAHEIVAVLVAAEVNLLSAAERQSLQTIISAGSVDISGPLIRSLFPAASATRAAIIALATEPTSRAFELGLGETVLVRHIVKARAV